MEQNQEQRAAQGEISILRWHGDQCAEARDVVALEEPLEIRINGQALAVTMRTPGDDFALAAGFLLSEGVIHSADEIQGISYCSDPAALDLRNIVNVYLDTAPDPGDERWKRRFTTTSSCGLCGKATIEAVRCLAPPLPDNGLRVPAAVIQALPDRMRAAQQTFQRTGGLHASGLFDRDGNLLSLREDVGRHNALDKLIGAELLAERLPLSARLLLVSGRTSFELLQKAAVARIPLLCAVSAPSSLAVELARDLNITLVGFLRGKTMNVYAAPQRIAGAELPVRP